MVKILKLVFIAGFIGLFSGALSSAFLYLLSLVTEIRTSNQHLIWGLPVLGLLLSFVMKRIPTHINQGVPYLIQELDNEKAPVSPWMAPFVFISSLGTHLFGGSAGREGVGVIMGASIAHVLPKFGSHFQNLRKFLLYGGIAAGFSSIFGTPLAAIVFAFELHAFRHIKRVDLLVCTTLASFSAFLISHLLGPTHQHFAVSLQINEVLPYILIAGFISGGGAHIFYWSYKAYSALISKLLPHLTMRLTLGALLISTLV